MPRCIVWSRERNFGDQLNFWLWPKVFPGFFQALPDHVFYGCGTILVPAGVRPGPKIVFGAGHGFGAPPFDGPSPPKDWAFFCVRGPNTRRALQLPHDVALGDAALLTHLVRQDRVPRSGQISFMPHVGMTAVDAMIRRACQDAGVSYLDPRSPVDVLLNEIERSKLVISEAMHGVILADTLRKPWIAVRPANESQVDKWADWAMPVSADVRFADLYPKEVAKLADRIRRRRSVVYNLKRLLRYPVQLGHGHRAFAIGSTLPWQSPQRAGEYHFGYESDVVGAPELGALPGYDRYVEQMSTTLSRIRTTVEPALSPDRSFRDTVSGMAVAVHRLSRTYGLSTAL